MENRFVGNCYTVALCLRCQMQHLHIWLNNRHSTTVIKTPQSAFRILEHLVYSLFRIAWPLNREESFFTVSRIINGNSKVCCQGKKVFIHNKHLANFFYPERSLFNYLPPVLRQFKNPSVDGNKPAGLSYRLYKIHPLRRHLLWFTSCPRNESPLVAKQPFVATIVKYHLIEGAWQFKLPHGLGIFRAALWHIVMVIVFSHNPRIPICQRVNLAQTELAAKVFLNNCRHIDILAPTTVEEIKILRVSRNPQIAVSCRHNTYQMVCRQLRVVSRNIAECCEAVAVKTRQSVPCSKPYEIVRALGNTANHTCRQSVSCTKRSHLA